MWGNSCQRACSHEHCGASLAGRVESFLASIDFGNHDGNEKGFHNMDLFSIELKWVNRLKNLICYIVRFRTQVDIRFKRISQVFRPGKWEYNL